MYFSCNFCVVYLGSVSYTHLDVYKRQGYDELVKRLDIERVSDNKYLPCEVVGTANDKSDNIDYLLYDETDTAVDNDNNETVIDIIMTDHTKGDWTILGDNRLYDLITWNNPCLLYTSRCV